VVISASSQTTLRVKEVRKKIDKRKEKKTMMMSSEAIFCVLVVHLLMAAESLVISPRWSHLRWKTVAPARVDVRASGQVVLTCTATGSPAPAVAWYKDGLFTAHPELADDQRVEHASLGETVAKLRLSCASKETVGNYECRARSGEQELSAVTKVELADWSSGDLCSEAGTPEVAAWSPTLMVEEGTDAVLRCRAMSNEDNITTTWLNDKGEEVGKGERHSVTSSGDLVVRDVSFADMGTYTCRLTNKMGSDQVDTFLYPLAPGN